MQEFLSEVLMMVLQEKSEKEILDRITEFLENLSNVLALKKVLLNVQTKLDTIQLEEKQGKANMPGHVRASINWNTLKRMNGDKSLRDCRWYESYCLQIERQSVRLYKCCISHR